MILVIEVRDNQVSQAKSYLNSDMAMSFAVKIVLEQGVSDSEEEIRKELEDEGQYIPSKYPEWSVAVVNLPNA